MTEELKQGNLRKMIEPNLIALGLERFGLNLEGMPKDQMIDEILSAQADGAEAPAKPLKEAAHGKAMHRLTIHSSDSPGGHDDVPIGINGYVYLVKRDVEVTVPVEVISALRDAVTTKYEQQGVDKTTGEMSYRTYNARRFNFSENAI